ncbi:hypothetical protein SDC9_08584 [bioreactor metagenome]|uniref:Peptidase C39 domain-containing protein n=1 Tax=bioreactor metagenome TaxID=1076179 RepID=A0A644T825_9ZZZZ|nr:right-handed parallel beta-helix repeat-containing protein [Methanobrevibacter sp.]MEA4957473.1 right-handed parallel beta-helix repeat-containing protein [Methanobrevibacter sp.]
MIIIILVGGAIISQGSSNFKIINCYFENNTALTYGGAIGLRNYGTGAEIINCTFVNNKADNGGAIYVLATATISGSVFTNNKAADDGGAIYNLGTLKIIDSNFTNNNANNNGGAIYSNKTININNTNFNNNAANNNGGAIYSESTNNNINIYNSLFNYNKGLNGGAIYSQNPLSIFDSNFTNNIASNANAAVIYSTDAILIKDCNFIGNNGRVLVLSGDGTIISGNNFIGNTEHAIRSINIKNAVINDNVFRDNNGIGIFLTGSNIQVNSNNFRNNRLAINITGNNIYISQNNVSSKNEGMFISGSYNQIINNKIFKNGKSGIILKGNYATINGNNISNSKKYGLYLVGKNAKISNNNIQNNLNGIYIKGNNPTITNNYIFKNNGYGIYLESNSTQLINNKISNNKIGLNIKGKKNHIDKNIINSNTKNGLILYGNLNTVKNNIFSRNKIYALVFSGNNNIININNISNSKYGFSFKGKSNKLSSNIFKSNKIGLLIQGDKNSISLNTIRSNNIGINHKSGKSNKIIYNNIVNKKINLQRVKGTLDANYNWWGRNKIDKVKNIKISRYVIATLSVPKASYLKTNTTYSINFILKDDKNRNLKYTIPSISAQSSLKAKLNNKTSTSLISTARISFSKNKLKINIKILNKDKFYFFMSKVDLQLLKHTFYPPADLDLKVISYSAPSMQGFVDTCQVKIKNLGNRNAHNITLKSKFPKFTRAVYSFDGLKWEKFSKSIFIDKIVKHDAKTIYIRGQLKKNYKGKFNTTFIIKTSTPESNYKNNKKILNIKVGGKKHYTHCGALILEIFLFNHGISSNYKKLMKELKNDKKGTSFYNMIDVSKKYGVKLNGVSLNLKKLRNNDIALIKLRKKITHYVLIIHISKNYVKFVDPLLGPVILKKQDFSMLFTGKVLTKRDYGKRISLKTLKITKGTNAFGVIGSATEAGFLLGGPVGAVVAAGVASLGYAFYDTAVNSKPINYNKPYTFNGAILSSYGVQSYYGSNYVPVFVDPRKIENDGLNDYANQARNIAKGGKANLANTARWLPYLTGAGLLSSNSPKIMSKVTLILLMGENSNIHELDNYHRNKYNPSSKNTRQTKNNFKNAPNPIPKKGPKKDPKLDDIIKNLKKMGKRIAPFGNDPVKIGEYSRSARDLIIASLRSGNLGKFITGVSKFSLSTTIIATLIVNSMKDVIKPLQDKIEKNLVNFFKSILNEILKLNKAINGIKIK